MKLLRFLELDEIVHQTARAIEDRQAIHLTGNGFERFKLLQPQHDRVFGHDLRRVSGLCGARSQRA